MNERIKKIRKILNLTQQEFADHIGISRNNIASYETGRSNLGNAVISLICKTFNVNETWLRTGNGEIFYSTPETYIDELVKKFNLDELDHRIVLGYLQLNEMDRASVKRFIKSIVANYSDAEIATDDKCHYQQQNASQDTNDMEITSELTSSPDKELDVMSELAEIKRQNQEMKRQNQEMAQQNREVVRQNKELLTRLEILEKEGDEWEREHTKQNISPTRSHTQ